MPDKLTKASPLERWFRQLRQLQICCQNPHCAGALKILANTKPSDMIPADDHRDEFSECFQRATQLHIQPEAFDQKSFRLMLEFISNRLTAVTSRFVLDEAGATHGDPAKLKIALLFPDPHSRTCLFDHMAEAVGDSEVGGMFPATPDARQAFLKKFDDAELTVQHFAERVFPA